MTEPPAPPDPPPSDPPASPWNRGPQPAGTAGSPWNPPPARSGPGCSKPLLIGCGSVLVLLGIGAILFMVKAQSFVQWYFGWLEGTMVARLPDDATPAERQRLQAAFAAARAAVAADTADPARLQAFQRAVLKAAGPEKKMTHPRLLDLTQALEGLAHGAPGHPRAPGVPAAPSPPPAGSPSGPAAGQAPP